MTVSNKIGEILDATAPDKKDAFQKLFETIKTNIPKGFEISEGSGMIHWVVPHTIFPAGYHCNPKQPLPFLSIAAQKNFIALYHMGMYADAELLQWFVSEYPKYSKYKLDMGKSCVRFKKPDDIPFDLIAKLIKKMSVKQWIALYTTVINKP